MSLSERARDFLFFFGGIWLGIVGNLFAEFLMAYIGAIPPHKAIIGMLASILVITAEIIIVSICTLK